MEELDNDIDTNELPRIIEDIDAEDDIFEVEYDLLEYLEETGIIHEYGSDEILIIDCPGCGNSIYYDGSEFLTCRCCRYVNLADHREEAYTLGEYEERDE